MTTKSNKKLIKNSSNSSLTIEAIDAIIKSGKDLIELMNEMKRAIMERALNTEMNLHLENNKNESNINGNYDH